MGSMLIVDDEVEVCDACREFFSLKGYDVHVALDGIQAVNMVKEIRPQVVLLDIVLPGMWGIDVLKAIKKIDPLINVVMVTAIGDERMAKDAFKWGALAHMTKPLDFNNLNDKILSKILLPLKKKEETEADQDQVEAQSETKAEAEAEVEADAEAEAQAVK